MNHMMERWAEEDSWNPGTNLGETENRASLQSLEGNLSAVPWASGWRTHSFLKTLSVSEAKKPQPLEKYRSKQYVFIRILGRSGNASLKEALLQKQGEKSHSGRHAAYVSWYQMKKQKDKRGGGTWNISPLTKCIAHFRSIPCGVGEVKVLVLCGNAFK